MKQGRMSYSINFVCRESKANKKGFAPIEMYVIYNRVRVFITLPRKEQPSVFKAKYSAKKNNDLKTFCFEQYSMVQTKIVEMMQQGVEISAESIKEYIYGIKKIYSISKMFEDFFKDIETKEMSYKNFMKYHYVKNLFSEVIDFNLDCCEISNSTILSYKNLLYKRYEKSTIAGYMSHLKSIILYGIAKGVIKGNPFEGIKIDKTAKEVLTITDNEFSIICNKSFSIDRLEKVRELFVIACSSGLAYIDIINLVPSDFSIEDNRVMIVKKRQKTNVTYYSVVLNEGVKILEKYNYDLSSLNLSNQKCNSYLKEIQDLCDIKSVPSLHFHLARHFYATHIINSGVPLDIVSKCLGHRTTRITVQYAKEMPSTAKKNVLKAFKNIE